MSNRTLPRALLVPLLLLPSLAGSEGTNEVAPAVQDLDRIEGTLSHLEEGLLELEVDLRSGLLPGPRSRTIFASRLYQLPLEGEPTAGVVQGPRGVEVRTLTWRVAVDSVQVSVASLQPWPGPLDLFARIDNARISIVDGEPLAGDERQERFRSRHTLRLIGTSVDGAAAVVKGGFELEWRRAVPTASDGHAVEAVEPALTSGWQIVEWSTGDLVATLAPQRFFADVLESAVPQRLASELIHSRHERYIEEYLRDPGRFQPPHPLFEAISHDRHPSLSVVDIDDDGWDDLYVMSRWEPNRLLRNRRDGTFEEVAARYGLAVDGLTSCALFLDFDNDGDRDVFLCRTLERSLLLINEGGRYVDGSDRSSISFPKHVASASAADYDGDGLLDLYVATYAKTLTRGWPLEQVIGVDPALPLPSTEQLAEMMASERPWTNVYGPANMLLRNQGGGRFEPAEPESGATVWRHTYQASWSDYDRDGDPDLYLANDYGPNELLRNRGDGRFESAGAELEVEDLGFGMGASWGDYDRDLDLDLYVSNMFSKAGKRITRRLTGPDSDVASMARGNSLLRNEGDRFERISGRPGFEGVERTGWSWGGQFADLDNDGWLDLTVLNGYYTVPAHLRLLPVDT